MINQVNNQELNTINWRDSIHFDSAKMTTEQVVETSDTVNSNSPIQGRSYSTYLWTEIMLSCRRMFRCHHCLYHWTSSPNKSFHSLIKILRKHFTSFGDIRKKTQRTSGGFLRKFDPSFSGVQMWRGGGGEEEGRLKKRSVFSFRPVLKRTPTTCNGEESLQLSIIMTPLFTYSLFCSPSEWKRLVSKKVCTRIQMHQLPN